MVSLIRRIDVHKFNINDKVLVIPLIRQNEIFRYLPGRIVSIIDDKTYKVDTFTSIDIVLSGTFKENELQLYSE